MAEAHRRSVLSGVVGLSVLLTFWLGAIAPQGASAQDDLHGEVVRFEAVESSHLHLADRGRYAGALELSAALPGTVVNEVGVEDYVAGVDEMPSRWHPEALRAQAIVARTYAWHVLRLDAYDGYDICATTACQVYRGIGGTEDDDRGASWLEAVRDTEGQVLLYEGEPILARYFSTSGGRTVANEVAFPSQGPRPYLVGVDDPYDDASPYHRWTVRFTRDEFDTLLGRGETLAAAVPVAEVERIGGVDDPNATIRVTGRDGTEVVVGAREFADFVSRVAPDSFPDRFPGRRADGFRPLPSTVPSSRFAPEVDDDEVVLHGRGWGHAVGLGQYAANARANDGHDHREILATYYDGLQPTTTEELPTTIRVGLEEAGPHTITPTGVARLLIDGEVAVDRVLGTWTATSDGDGWQLEPPPGHDDPLEVSATRHGAATSGLADAATVEVDVNKPALLRLEVTGPDGQPVTRRDLGSVDAGSHTATWRAVDEDGEPLPAGNYRVALMAEDARGETAGGPVTVTVDRSNQVSDGSTGRSSGDSGLGGAVPTFVVVATVALVIALVTLGLTGRRRRS